MPLFPRGWAAFWLRSLRSINHVCGCSLSKYLANRGWKFVYFSNSPFGTQLGSISFLAGATAAKRPVQPREKKGLKERAFPRILKLAGGRKGYTSSLVQNEPTTLTHLSKVNRLDPTFLGFPVLLLVWVQRCPLITPNTLSFSVGIFG